MTENGTFYFRGSDPNDTDDWGHWGPCLGELCPWSDVVNDYIWEYAE